MARVVVKDKTLEIYVVGTKAPALEVPKLGSLARAAGLWVGKSSDGHFSALRITKTN